MSIAQCNGRHHLPSKRPLHHSRELRVEPLEPRLVLSHSSLAADASPGPGELLQLFSDHRVPAVASSELGNSDSQADRSRNLSLIGSNDLGGGGFNTDVWAHGDFAYVGTWGAGPDFCPNHGTKVIDISDPSNPQVVNTLPAPLGTQTNDIKVADINTRFFRGDLLVVSNEDCAPGGARGVELWDVTDPTDPQMLSRFGAEETDPLFPFDTPDIGFGIHNSFLYQKGNRAYVALVPDLAEIVQVVRNQLGVSTPITGEFQILDVTDPRDPFVVSTWGLKQDLGKPVGVNFFDPSTGEPVFILGEDCRPECRGEDVGANILHDVWVNRQGTVAYLSYWDQGLVLLDISDPANPTLIGNGEYTDDQGNLIDEGNTHVAVPARGGNLVITGDEDFTPGPWGFLRVFDTSDPANPVQVGSFGTENALGPRPDFGDYSAHNIIVRGNTAYASWYSDGIRLIDISDPTAPRETGSFVFPDVSDPQGFWPSKSLIWGVYVHNDLILASDINAGLYVLKPVSDKATTSNTVAHAALAAALPLPVFDSDVGNATQSGETRPLDAAQVVQTDNRMVDESMIWEQGDWSVIDRGDRSLRAREFDRKDIDSVLAEGIGAPYFDEVLQNLLSLGLNGGLTT